MARLVLCVLGLVASGLASPSGHDNVPHKVGDSTFAQRQLDIYQLLVRMHAPSPFPRIIEASKWDLKENINHYNLEATSSIREYTERLTTKNILPKWVPFSILDRTHRYEAKTVFTILFGAKDWDTFFKTAAFLRSHCNEYLFVYVLSAAILHRPDTQDIILPQIYEIFPSFFHNGEVINIAQNVNVQGKSYIENYLQSSTFFDGDNVVIRWNETIWPNVNRAEDRSVFYFTHDHGLNTFYYNHHLTYPFWLSRETCPVVKERRGELFLYVHKNILARYYMERLSNGLGEIPVLDMNLVKQGYSSGLIYSNGIPYPIRPNHYHLEQPDFVEYLTKIDDSERQIRGLIQKGVEYFGRSTHHVVPEEINTVGLLIESNVDSPLADQDRDFISIWKSILGNSGVHKNHYYHNDIPLVIPSTLEHYQTAVRDPAFYMIWKRVLSLQTLWQEELPLYTTKELALPSVAIQKVDTDKLLTFFEYTYLNVTNDLVLTEHQREAGKIDHGIVAQRPQLNHKEFEIRINVKSEVPQTVTVNFFLAPKYDSHGNKIPLQYNTENFFHFDQFTYELPQGETVIKRKSTENVHTTSDWTPSYEIAQKALKAVETGEPFVLEQAQKFASFPRRLLLPKGRVGGMPFIFLVYINAYKAPEPSNVTVHGSGTHGTRFLTGDRLGFPLDRPLHHWQIKSLKNIWLEDVAIYHKPTTGIDF